jgi:hypothetical protein
MNKPVESKKKILDRATQDAQEDFESQRRELVNKLLTKLAPIVQKYFTTTITISCLTAHKLGRRGWWSWRVQQPTSHRRS